MLFFTGQREEEKGPGPLEARGITGWGWGLRYGKTPDKGLMLADIYDAMGWDYGRTPFKGEAFVAALEELVTTGQYVQEGGAPWVGSPDEFVAAVKADGIAFRKKQKGGVMGFIDDAWGTIKGAAGTVLPVAGIAAQVIPGVGTALGAGLAAVGSAIKKGDAALNVAKNLVGAGQAAGAAAQREYIAQTGQQLGSTQFNSESGSGGGSQWIKVGLGALVAFVGLKLVGVLR